MYTVVVVDEVVQEGAVVVGDGRLNYGNKTDMVRRALIKREKPLVPPLLSSLCPQRGCVLALG